MPDLLSRLKDFHTIGVSEWACIDVPLDNYVVNHTTDFINPGLPNAAGVANARKLLASDTLKLIKDSAIVTKTCPLGPNTFGLWFDNYEKATKLECIPPLKAVPTTGTGTVTRCCLDLALHLGYKEIYILGMDMKTSVFGYTSHYTPFSNPLPARHKTVCYYDVEKIKGHEKIWKERLTKHKDKLIATVSPFGPPADWSWFPVKTLPHSA